MKKVLILAYDFPPYVSVGGLRPYSWLKYFPEFGIEPIVITRQWSNTHGSELDYIASGFSQQDVIEKVGGGLIIRTSYQPNWSNRLLLKYGATRFRLLRKTISAFYEFAQFVLPLGPKRKIYKSARKYLQENNVDAIIATGDPFVLFHYANKLSYELNVPWIADYRDPWSMDIPLQKKPILRRWSKFHEKRLLKKANAVVAVSSFVAQQVVRYFTEKIHIIPNGYDQELIAAASVIPQQKNVMSIAYAGTIYNWHPVELFLKALDQWVIANPNYPLQLNFYGINNKEQISHLIDSNFPTLNSVVVFHNRMSNKDLLMKMASDNILLLFNYYSFMGTKIYDYLGLKRQILFCFTSDKEALTLKEKYYHIDESVSPNLRMQADLIEQTESGILVEDADQLGTALTKLAEEFYCKGHIRCKSKNVEQFSRKERTQQLVKVVKSLQQ